MLFLQPSPKPRVGVVGGGVVVVVVVVVVVGFVGRRERIGSPSQNRDKDKARLTEGPVWEP